MRNFFFLILKIDHFQQFVHFYSANSFGKSFFSRLFLFARGPEGLECCESLECCCCVVVVSKGKQASDPLVLCGLFFCQPTFFFLSSPAVPPPRFSELTAKKQIYID